MKFLIIFILLSSSLLFNAQQKEFWVVDVQTSKKVLVKDSAAAVRFLDSLSQNSFYLTELKKVTQDGNKTEIYYDKGKDFNEVHVNLSDEIQKNAKLQRSFFTKNLDSLKKEISENYRNRGYAFNRVKSKFIGMKDGIPQVQVSVIPGNQRKIDSFEFRGYEKLPKRFVKNLEKEFRGKIYEDKNLVQINKSLQNHPFLLLDKPPQTLFTKDSTQIFLFTQKKKSNTFDGIIGFGNDKTDKFTFNGSINVNFRNMFNSFESINIYWQRNPDRGQTFDLKTDIPYLFGSNVGTNINVNIFRQDSTFANVKFIPGFYIHLNNRQKLGVRGTFETSTVMDSLYTGGKDYNKKGIGAFYEYLEPSEIELFLYRTRIRAEADYISTNYSKENQNVAQNNFYLFGERNFHIKANHYLNLKGETAMISSKNEFAANELLRFGGWNSLRGFNENSLYADFYYYGNAEYRYVTGNQAFFDIFGQYAQLNNKTLSLKPKFYSFGFGFNFFLPIGLMSFQISNGNEFGNPIKFSDTKIHWGILTRF
ncbi:BamA/TamA family outer membrane protein [Chryseobacterium koreense]|uniref:POTRA domain-containing protein n=1 Tax=Chryseobacterium koreense CCUG 49689 TaxID=1304281 RepID=A0A0J7J0X5_9FLAO|nr:hypothetical protein [Chryseobacterium koreense]KMQ71714.1 hypothetical protein ACM44_05700 [Chryseobacterium koreense CCUG 49689]MBB5333150.1 outer membrane protein assembly factor BamA [Chryseobacterium koreense]